MAARRTRLAGAASLMPFPGRFSSLRGLIHVTAISPVWPAGRRLGEIHAIISSFGQTGMSRRLFGHNASPTPCFFTVPHRSEEHTSELPSLMRTLYALLSLQK